MLRFYMIADPVNMTHVFFEIDHNPRPHLVFYDMTGMIQRELTPNQWEPTPCRNSG